MLQKPGSHLWNTHMHRKIQAWACVKRFPFSCACAYFNFVSFPSVNIRERSISKEDNTQSTLRPCIFHFLVLNSRVSTSFAYAYVCVVIVIVLVLISQVWTRLKFQHGGSHLMTLGKKWNNTFHTAYTGLPVFWLKQKWNVLTQRTSVYSFLPARA